MSESTLSAWSLSIHVPRGGGVGGGSIPQSFCFAVLVYIFAKMYLNTSFLTSLGCSIGIHLPKMCARTKFPMFSFVRGSNPCACTNTWETRETDEKKRGIHEKNVKFMKKTCNSLKKTWKSWKKPEIHEKNVQFMKKNVKFMEKNVKFIKKCTNTWETRQTHEKEHEIRQILSEMPLRARIHGNKCNSWKNVKFMEKNVKFMKTTWNSWKKRAIHGKKREIHEKNVEFMKKKREIHGKQRGNHGKKREIHGKQREIHKKKRTIHEKTVKFRKMYWNTSFLIYF